MQGVDRLLKNHRREDGNRARARADRSLLSVSGSVQAFAARNAERTGLLRLSGASTRRTAEGESVVTTRARARCPSIRIPLSCPSCTTSRRSPLPCPYRAARPAREVRHALSTAATERSKPPARALGRAGSRWPHERRGPEDELPPTLLSARPPQARYRARSIR